MLSSVASIVLNRNENLLNSAQPEAGDQRRVASAPSPSGIEAQRPFLRIPPFPGAKVEHFSQLNSTEPAPSDIVEEVRRLRVGGAYWGAQPALPTRYVLVRSSAALEASRQAVGSDETILWSVDRDQGVEASCRVISGECDPWHMLRSARALFTDLDDEIGLIARLCDVPVYVLDGGTGRYVRRSADNARLLRSAIPSHNLLNPFSMEPMTALQAVRLCGFWRQLIDSNREISAGAGFAFWKQRHVAPLLWGGNDAFRFLRNPQDGRGDGSVAVWRSKVRAETLVQLEYEGAVFVEVEDGFLRSQGLGADCIPPLSITVDRAGAHFDPSNASELEALLQCGTFTDDLLERARELRALIVENGLSKYEQGRASQARRASGRRHILVPGQVEDDRSVLLGGCGLSSNLELLKRVREQAPDAYVLYKPHPDVLAGHRRGMIPEWECLHYADEIVGDLPIASLISMVDEVHVNTSLAGFEAVLRRKPVTVYGVPFYAGWGLTTDLGPVPARRTARRTLDELVAAALLLYPRYLDPVTGLPCPAEALVARLCHGAAADPGLLVRMRRLQGKLMRRFGLVA